MKRRPALLTAASTALAVTAAAHPAVASPPSGLFGFEEYGQARVVSPASLEFPVGKEVALGNYALAAGADSGWRRTVGESVFAVTAGTLSVESGADCRTTAYRAGEATVLPAGVYRITDAGNDAVAMAVAFLNLPTGGAKPFADGPPQPAPRGCASPAGAEQSGVSVGRYARATMSPPDTYGTSEHSGHSGQVDVTDGSDVVGSIYTLEPGFASGWFQHGPALNLITKGVLTYYEAHDGHCV
jgi:quercetin dioxygenase-like cupin family protein